MGSSASKAARKLPTSTPSAKRAPPSWAGARTPHPAPLYPEGSAPTPGSGSASASGQPRRPLPSHLNPSAPEAEASAGGAVYNRPTPRQGQGAAPMGKARPGFSGEKDDAVRRDAMDPQFASNLSRLGQVKINDAGKFFSPPAPAQRTLNARTEEFTSTSAAPPPNHLTANMLISLLDRLKALPTGADPTKIYKEYNMDPATMSKLRRWVNSPSVVGDDHVVGIIEGEEQIEMQGRWVDSAGQAPPSRIASPKSP